MYDIIIKIDDLPMTRNAIADRRWTRKKEADKWHQLIAYAINERPIEPLKKAQLTLTRYSSAMPDYDGLVSSFKFPIDGLVKVNILKDDNLKVVEHPQYHWKRVKPKQGYIEIRVQEIV